ncbi:MAG: hypothetical protein H0T60_02320 [Acidobacteria bacterium]|nr:hypothetical protein [Acidobacteriota bacterium]
MKVKVYVARVITIPDEELPRLAESARRDRRRRKDSLPLREFPIAVFELVEQAAVQGVVDLGEDYSFPLEDERKWVRGKLISPEEYFESLKTRKKP